MYFTSATYTDLSFLIIDEMSRVCSIDSKENIQAGYRNGSRIAFI